MGSQGAAETAYNVFGWLQIDPSGVATGDRGFGCQVSFVAGSVGMQCSEITLTSLSAVSLGASISVTGVFGDATYFGGTLHFSLGQFPEIWNRTYAATKGDKVWVTASIAAASGTALTNFDDVVGAATDPSSDLQFAYSNMARLSAPVCA